MSPKFVYTIEPFTWITILIILVIGSILNVMIFKKEYNKRKLDKISFQTKYISSFSLLCMICAVLIFPFDILTFIPFTCFAGAKLGHLVMNLEGFFFGFFQLSRLHYCFAQTQVYSNYGYSNYVFIIMFGFGIFWIIYTLFYLSITGIVEDCGYNDQDYWFIILYDPIYIPGSAIGSLAILMYSFWDITTVFLYITKLYQFKKLELLDTDTKTADTLQIHKRINYILNRIIILTVFNEMAMYFVWLLPLPIKDVLGLPPDAYYLHWQWHVGIVSTFTTMNYSIFLMQEHNTKEYNDFLKTLHRLKIHRICLCFRSIIIGGIEYDQELKMMEININQKDDMNMDETVLDTKTIGEYPNRMKQNELSMETVSVNDPYI